MNENNWLGSLLDDLQRAMYHPFVASLIGAFGAAVHAFPGATTSAKALNGVSCFFIGIYMGPAVIEWRGIVSEKISAAIIIACALGGLIVVNACLEYLRTTKLANMPFLRSFFAPTDKTGATQGEQ